MYVHAYIVAIARNFNFHYKHFLKLSINVYNNLKIIRF